MSHGQNKQLRLGTNRTSEMSLQHARNTQNILKWLNPELKKFAIQQKPHLCKGKKFQELIELLRFLGLKWYKYKGIYDERALFSLCFWELRNSNGLSLALLDFYLDMELWNSPWCLGLLGKFGLDHWLLLSPLPCCLSACHFSRKHGNFGCYPDEHSPNKWVSSWTRRFFSKADSKHYGDDFF